MSDVIQPVQTAAAPAAGDRALPDNVIAAATQAGFPAALGDPASFIRYSQLDASNPKARTVSHLVEGAGIGPYNALGRSIQDSVQAMNRTRSPNFQLSSIYGEFIGFDMQAFARLDRAGRQQATAALQRLNAALSGASAPAAGPAPAGAVVDGVDPARQTPVNADMTSGAAAALTPPTTSARNGESLPDHPSLAGTSPEWRAWLQRGDHRMQTVEALLGEKPASFSAGLEQVQQRFGLGQEGRPANLEALTRAVQGELGAPFASAGTPDGKVGRTTIGALAEARDAIASTLATEGGVEYIRSQFPDRPNLMAAILPTASADTAVAATPTEQPVEAASAAEAAPSSATTPNEAAPADTGTTIDPAVTDTGTATAPAVTATSAAATLLTPVGPEIQQDAIPQDYVHNYAELAKLRSAGGPAWTAARDSVIAEANGRAWRMADITHWAAAQDSALANDLASAFLTANAPSFWSPNRTNRDFARKLFAQDPQLANTLSPDVLARLSTSLAIPIGGGAITGAVVPPEDSAAVKAYETAFLRQAQSPDVLNDNAHYFHALANVDPAVVADAFGRFGPDAQRALGNRMVDYILGTRAANLGAKEARLAAIIRAMRERGIEAGTVEEFTGTWRLGGNLTERVVRASAVTTQ